MRKILVLVPLLAGAAAVAQESASYRLEQFHGNSGGRPLDGTVATSASYRVSLDAIGDAVSPTALSSASYEHEAGFVPAYLPPDEVLGLVFEDQVSLRWEASRAAGTYNLYRGLLTGLPGLAFGACTEQEIAGTATSDSDLLASGQGFFYLVTVENRLGEEGTKGSQSSGTERTGSVCP